MARARLAMLPGDPRGAGRLNMQAWGHALTLLGRPWQSAEYATDASTDFNLLHSLQLPTYHGLLLPCQQFLSEFEHYEKTFVFPHYFLSLSPREPELPKYSLLDFATLRTARKFILRSVGRHCTAYYLHISEYERNCYGGSIMSDSGMVITELAPGVQQSISQGVVVPATATLHELSLSTHYSTPDQLVRRLLWRAMLTISRTGTDLLDCVLNGVPVQSVRGYVFLRGYFEFAYTGEPDSPVPRLVFFDAKLNPAYTVNLPRIA